jgi:hypothetical protein
VAHIQDRSWLRLCRGLAIGSASIGFTLVAATSFVHPVLAQTGATATGFVGGTTPDRRPEGAPRVTSFTKSKAWWTKARRGITKPYPKDLEFLEAQGAWFTPFDHPGMRGPYDIRGLHGARRGQR